MFRSCFRNAALIAASATLISPAARGGEANEIIVTASPFSHDADGIATIVGQVDRAEILRHGGASLADALDEVPGVTGSGFTAGSSRPVIRGFDANRVRILENGVGSFDVSDVGPDHGVPIDPLSAQRIEVVRGAATLRFGSQAIGGVVNAINNRIPPELPARAAAAEATAAYSTNAAAGQGSAMLDTREGRVALHADGFLRRTGDYAIPGGEQSNSFFKGGGLSLGGSAFFGESRVGAAVVHYDATYGIPGEDNFIALKQTKGLFGSSFAMDAGALETLTIDGGYADYKHTEEDDTGAVHATFLDKEWDSRAEALFGGIGPFSAAALGLQVQHKNFSALGEGEDFLLPTTTQTVAGFGFAEASLASRLRLQLGARLEHVRLDGTPLSNLATRRSFTPVSGSAGLVFDPAGGVTLGMSLASAARAPAQTELLARGPHEASATYEIGDPDLTSERANSLEATLRWEAGPLDLEASVWGAKFENYVYGRLTGRLCDENGDCTGAGDLKELIFEQRGATFKGVEAKADIALYRATGGVLSALVLADAVRARFAPRQHVPRVPPYHIGGGLSWTSTKIDGGFVLKYTGAQNRVAFADTPTKGYASLDAELVWRPLSSKPDMELAVVGRNLTDRLQRNAIALNKDTVVLPGRDVRFVIRSTF